MSFFFYQTTYFNRVKQMSLDIKLYCFLSPTNPSQTNKIQRNPLFVLCEQKERDSFYITISVIVIYQYDRLLFWLKNIKKVTH